MEHPIRLFRNVCESWTVRLVIQIVQGIAALTLVLVLALGSTAAQESHTTRR